MQTVPYNFLETYKWSLFSRRLQSKLGNGEAKERRVKDSTLGERGKNAIICTESVIVGNEKGFLKEYLNDTALSESSVKFD